MLGGADSRTVLPTMNPHVTGPKSHLPISPGDTTRFRRRPKSVPRQLLQKLGKRLSYEWAWFRYRLNIFRQRFRMQRRVSSHLPSASQYRASLLKRKYHIAQRRSRLDSLSIECIQIDSIFAPVIGWIYDSERIIASLY